MYLETFDNLFDTLDIVNIQIVQKSELVKELDKKVQCGTKILEYWQKVFIQKIQARYLMKIDQKELDKDYEEIVKCQKLLYGMNIQKILILEQIKENLQKIQKSRFDILKNGQENDNDIQMISYEDLLLPPRKSSKINKKYIDKQIYYDNDEEFNPIPKIPKKKKKQSKCKGKGKELAIIPSHHYKINLPNSTINQYSQCYLID